MSKRLSKYIATFDYSDKTLIVLSSTSGVISVASLASFIGTHIELASASFSFAFSLTTGIKEKLLKTTRNKKKKLNKTVILARSKLTSIEKLISQALIAFNISHEECTTIINEEENTEA